MSFISSFLSELPLSVILSAVAVLLAVILFSLLKKLFKFLLHALVGLVLLYVCNSFGSLWGLYLPMNLGNCLTAGFLGLPGVLILLVWNYWIAS